MIEIHFICDCCKNSEILVAPEVDTPIVYDPIRHRLRLIVEDRNEKIPYCRTMLLDGGGTRVVSAVPYVKVRLCKTCSEKFDQYMLDEGRDKSRFNVYNLWTEFYNEQDHR